MGRYYSGDIEGKFWYGIQSSNDADFFGVTGTQPDILYYYFEETDISNVEKGIKVCQEELQEYETKLDKFFKEHECYSKEMLIEEGFLENRIDGLLKWYARLKLGEKIFKCLKEHGACCFEAEC